MFDFDIKMFLSYKTLIVASALFWFIYATLMTVIAKRKKYRKGSWQYWALTVAGYALVIPGLPYDVFYNFTWGSVLFRQFPRPRHGEWTFTARLQRTVKDKKTWRGKLARFICRYLVEPWDEGHCGMGKKP